MLPTIVIGADESTKDELNTRWWAATGAGALHGLAFYETAEKALFALADGLQVRTGKGPEDFATLESTPEGWPVNVLWGPNAWGGALSGQKPELAHTGWTAVFGAHINDTPEKPRRMLKGTPQGVDADTRPWQAGAMLRAQVVFDVFGEAGYDPLAPKPTGGTTAVAAIVDLFSSRDTP